MLPAVGCFVIPVFVSPVFVVSISGSVLAGSWLGLVCGVLELGWLDLDWIPMGLPGLQPNAGEQRGHAGCVHRLLAEQLLEACHARSVASSGGNPWGFIGLDAGLHTAAAPLRSPAGPFRLPPPQP